MQLSQSAYFDEADSEIQSIYERSVHIALRFINGVLNFQVVALTLDPRTLI